MTLSKSTADVKFSMTNIVVESIDIFLDFNANMSAMTVKTAPPVEMEHPITVKSVKIV